MKFFREIFFLKEKYKKYKYSIKNYFAYIKNINILKNSL